MRECGGILEVRSILIVAGLGVTPYLCENGRARPVPPKKSILLYVTLKLKEEIRRWAEEYLTPSLFLYNLSKICTKEASARGFFSSRTKKLPKYLSVKLLGIYHFIFLSLNEACFLFYKVGNYRRTLYDDRNHGEATFSPLTYSLPVKKALLKGGGGYEK